MPERLHAGLDFERLYDAFGGKLAHWQDYVTDYGGLIHAMIKSFIDHVCLPVNANGKLDSKRILNLYLTQF